MESVFHIRKWNYLLKFTAIYNSKFDRFYSSIVQDFVKKKLFEVTFSDGSFSPDVMAEDIEVILKYISLLNSYFRIKGI